MDANTSHKGVLTANDFRGPVLDRGDNRREPRFACGKMIDVLPVAAPENWEFESVELSDCSLHGLGFVSPKAMEVGTQFLVKLMLRERLRMLIYTVRHCRALPTRWFAVGAEFTGYIASPAEEDPHELLAEILKQEK